MELEDGQLREAMLAMEDACAMDCEVAEAMDWPVIAWALLLCTPVAVAWALEAEGAKEAVRLAVEARPIPAVEREVGRRSRRALG